MAVLPEGRRGSLGSISPAFFLSGPPRRHPEVCTSRRDLERDRQDNGSTRQPQATSGKEAMPAISEGTVIVLEDQRNISLDPGNQLSKAILVMYLELNNFFAITIFYKNILNFFEEIFLVFNGT
jgi:hypothetical protein